MGKIDDAADIIGKTHADRDQRICASDQKALDQRLQEKSVHARRSYKPRYAARVRGSFLSISRVPSIAICPRSSTTPRPA